MSEHKNDDYTFAGLCGIGGERSGSLAYLVGLVESQDHGITQLIPADRILAWLFDLEEQVKSASELLLSQDESFKRYFPMRFYPQTPVMLTRKWSPIGALLEQGLEPLVLRRSEKPRGVATGIWAPTVLRTRQTTSDCETVQELFWAILSEVFDRARQRRLLVSVIAKPGWNYETKIDSLPKWPREEVMKSDRILWKRTPECRSYP
jgi:hypothetical protein